MNFSRAEKSLLQQALHNMGYRALESNLWAKPFGYCLLMFNIRELRWSYACRHDSSGKMLPVDFKNFTIERENHLVDDLTAFLAGVEQRDFKAVSGHSIASAVPFDFRTEIIL